MKRYAIAILFAGAITLPALHVLRAQSPYPAPPSFASLSPGEITHTVMPGQAMPNPIPAGAVVQLGPGVHNMANKTWTAAGTATKPAFVVAAPGAILTGAEGHKLAGSYLVLDQIEAQRWRVQVNGHSIALRHVEASGHESSSGAVVSFGFGARDIVISDCNFHDNGWPAGTQESDFHGVKFSTNAAPARRVWILNHTSSKNGGDSVQVGSDSEVTAGLWPGEVYIVGGRFSDEGENGVDVKKAEDVLVYRTHISGMRGELAGDRGRGIVLHNGGRRVRVIESIVTNNKAEGFVSTGHFDLEVAGSHFEGNGIGVRAYSSSTGSVHHNTFAGSGQTHLNVTASGVTVHDNVVGQPSPSPSASPTPAPSPTPTPVPTPTPSAPPAVTCTVRIVVGPDGRLSIEGGPCGAGL